MSEAITTLSVPEAKALGVAGFLIKSGVPFAARPVKDNWSFAVEREDDDVFAVMGALWRRA